MFSVDPLFEIVTTRNGVVSIRNNQVNEIMHNPVGPWLEANQLYIQQSLLKNYLQVESSSEWVVFDVGLGAGANALATLHEARSSKRPLRLISFERDLDLIQFALKNSDKFEHFEGFESAIEELLAKGTWSLNGVTWELYAGDFLETINKVSSKADMVYYDPYSPKVNREMWTVDCFKKLYSQCKPRATFFNYSQATPIRVALLAAGFFVGYGVPTGLKETTTQAACLLEDLPHPLGLRWFERWKRSSTPHSLGCTKPLEESTLIEEHIQFRSLKREVSL